MYSQEMELSSCNIKKIIIFSQKKAFLLFQKMETLGKFLIFSKKKSCSYFPKNRNPKKLFIFQETKLSYISGETSKTKIY